MYYLDKPKKVRLGLTMRRSGVLLEELILAIIFGAVIGLLLLIAYCIFYDQELIFKLAIKAGAFLEGILE